MVLDEGKTTPFASQLLLLADTGKVAMTYQVFKHIDLKVQYWSIWNKIGLWELAGSVI